VELGHAALVVNDFIKNAVRKTRDANIEEFDRAGLWNKPCLYSSHMRDQQIFAERKARLERHTLGRGERRSYAITSIIVAKAGEVEAKLDADGFLEFGREQPSSDVALKAVTSTNCWHRR